MKKILLLIVVLFSTIFAMAQNKFTVSGRVVCASDNQVLVGVSIFEKISNSGTITDFDGNYSLEVGKGAILRFSMVGFISQEIVFQGQKVIDVFLQEDTKTFDEIVVVGYGGQKKSEITGSISSVKGSEINNFVSGNAINSLQSKVNGVMITSSGEPGAAPRVIIRGVTTVNGSSPLYVVDGMPVGDNINFLNSEDIEQLEVLKDASSAAIYGTRASNGVILITTKKGKNQSTKFQFSSKLGISCLKEPKMAQASEYEKVFKARYTNDNQTPSYRGLEDILDSEGTSWWKQTVNPYAYLQNYNFSFQGGNATIIYNGSFGYFRQSAHYDYGLWEKFTGRFNTQYAFNKAIKLGVELAPRMEKWQDTPNLMGAAMAMDPTTPIYVDGEHWGEDMYNNFSRSNNNQEWNPVANLFRQNAHSTEYGLMLNTFLEITPIKKLTIRSQFCDNARFRLSDDFTPKFFIDNLEQSSNSIANRKANTWNDYSWINTITYQEKIGKHNFTTMLGYTMEKYAYYWLEGSSQDIPSNNPNLWFVSAGSKNYKALGSDQFNTLVSYLGRLTYNYNEKYYLSFSLRSDGSSKFPSHNKYALFPSMGLSWRASSEEFLKNYHWLSNLKVRAGWGRVGNQNIDNSVYLSTIGTSYYVINNQMVVASNVSSTANTNIKWEKVEDINLGFDLGLMGNKFVLTGEIFNKKTSDMLLKERNLAILGYPEWDCEIWNNVGSMNSKGWEFSFLYQDQPKSQIKYSAGLNLSGVKNKAVDLGSSSPILTGQYNDDYIISNQSNGEISRFYGYRCLGIFKTEEELINYTNEKGDRLQPNAQLGDLIFEDSNNDGKIDASDKTFIGNAFPKLYLGLNLGFTYKEWELSASFYGTFGNDIFNLGKNYYSGVSGQNVYKGTLADAWSPENPNSKIPRLSYNDANANYKTVSDFFVENGSYLKLKQLQIGYNIPKYWVDGIGLRITISAQNFFTISKYSGMDPETAQTGPVTQTGIDNIAYPNPKVFALGINLNF